MNWVLREKLQNHMLRELTICSSFASFNSSILDEHCDERMEPSDLYYDE